MIEDAFISYRIRISTILIIQSSNRYSFIRNDEFATVNYPLVSELAPILLPLMIIA